MRSAFGAASYELKEVGQLDDHIRSRARRLSSSAGAHPSLIDDWVEANFKRPLEVLLVQASRNTRGHILLNLVVIGGGFVTSGIAVAAGGGHKGSATSWIVFSVGLIVALAGGIAQIFRPGYRSTQRLDLVMSLREEGWAFANASKPYDNNATAYEKFRERVSEIRRRTAQIVAPDSELLQARRRGR